MFLKKSDKECDSSFPEIHQKPIATQFQVGSQRVGYFDLLQITTDAMKSCHVQEALFAPDLWIM